jgi:hypothetical protein
LSICFYIRFVHLEVSTLNDSSLNSYFRSYFNLNVNDKSWKSGLNL